MGDTPPVFPFSQRRVVNRFRCPRRKRMVADGRIRSHGNKSSGPNQTSGRKALIVENRANSRLKINEERGQIGPCNQDVEIPVPGFATRCLVTHMSPARVRVEEPSCSKQTAKRRGPKDQGHKDSDGKIDQIEAAENSQNPDVPK